MAGAKPVTSVGGAGSSYDATPFDARVKEHGKITLGEAKAYANTLAPEQIYTACGCYVCYCPMCPSCCLGISCLINFCGCCLMYNPFMCACPEGSAGTWTCTDLKGVSYWLVPVDDAGTLAWFSEGGCEGNGSNLGVGCYCTKLC